MRIISKRYGGGGSNDVQTVQSIPEWAVPYLKNTLTTNQNLYNAGSYGGVAGVNPLLQTAFGSGAKAIGQETTEAVQSMENQEARLTDAAASGG